MVVDASIFLPESLILKVPEIDSQHQALFAQLVEIKAICVEENYLPLARAEELMLALQAHFNTEERLAFGAGYDFAEHARKHEKMLAAIRKGISKVSDGSKDVFGLLRYVEYWFERHIAEEDKALGARLLSSGVSEFLCVRRE